MILAIIITLILVLYVKIGSILPYLSYFLFGDSCRVNLKNVNSFDEYLKTLNNKKRKDLKRIIKKEYKNITIKPGQFQILYIKSLYTFIKNKYNDIFTIIFYISLSILLFLSNKLNFFEYYKDDVFLGWSSYFISNNVYYDFLSSPNKVNISIIGINSIKYCIENKIEILDMGPTNCDLKKRKFNAYLYNPQDIKD